ncbi:hypothetical protein PFISCL1PPCAC_23079, partial [Pristionchus fissidentatus]
QSPSGLCLRSTSPLLLQTHSICAPACHPTSEICHQGQCLCAGGYVRVQNNCQPAAATLLVGKAEAEVRRAPQAYGQSGYPSSTVNRPYPGGRLRSQANSVQAVPPDSVCGSDADCAGYPLAFCDGVCRCVAGALNAGSTCISNGNSMSHSGTCPPGQSYVTEAGSCMTTATPGEPCQYSQQCSAAEAGAFCLRLKCECVYGMKQSGTGCTFADTNCAKRGFIWIPEMGECKEVIPPGGRGCSHNLQCASSFQGSTCFLQTCTCPSTYPVAIDGTCGRNCTAGLTYSGVTGQCLPTVQPGDQCLYSSQCHAVHPGISCDRGRCRCPRDEVFTGNGCAITCPSGYRANSRGICSPGCRSNQVEHEGECHEPSVPGQACVVNAQCTGGSSCQDSLCKCARGMSARGGLCVAIESAPLGSCANGEICGGGSFCSNGNCACPVGRQVLNGRCVTPITVSPGADCLRQGVVCGGNSFCVRGLCQCRAGQQPFDGVCMHELTADAGESCARGESCVGGTVCNAISRVCECANSMEMAIGSRCVQRLQSHPGYPCGNGEVCVGGSVCQRGRCECPDGSQLNGKQCTVFEYARPGESCRNGEICEGGSNCMPTINRCTCPMGSQIIHSQCLRVVDMRPGARCDQPATRCSGGSFCNTDNFCTCPEGTHMIGEYCRPAPVPIAVTEPAPFTSSSIVSPGGECNSMTVCGSGTICLRGICQCPQGLSPDGRCLPVSTSTTAAARAASTVAETAATPPPTLMTTSPTSRAGSRRMVAAGGACTASDLCTGRSFCAHGACRCASPLIARAGSCTPPASSQVSAAAIGSRCSTTSDCPSSSVCNGGYCACPPGMTRASSTSCVYTTTTSTTTTTTTARSTTSASASTAAPTTPGRRCLAANQCPSGADCIQGECKCTQGLTLSKFGFCIPVTYANPGELCPQGTQCRGGSSCAFGRCDCPAEHDVRDGKCTPRGLSLSPPSSSFTLHYDSPRPSVLSACPIDGSCRAPDCYCSSSGTAPPSSLLPSQTPQMIVVTFEGPVTDRTTRVYKSLFSGRLRSHDCPLRATFFVSHEFTNYDQVQWLAARGNEIGVAGMGATSLSARSQDRWRSELQGMRMALTEFSKIEPESVKGVRAPGMKTGGDSHFSMLSAWNFTYDHSIAPDGGPFWPQTLDHSLPYLCPDGACPSKPVEGMWEAPVNRIITTDGRAVARLREAVRSSDTRASVKEMLRRNFNRNYQGSRAPLVLSLDADFLFSLPQNEAVNGLIDFLEEVLAKADVYPVTVSQLISWMRAPTSLDAIAKFKPFHCPRRANDHVQPCEAPSTCSFITPQGSRSFRVCGSCPKEYPGIEDPLGKGRR